MEIELSSSSGSKFILVKSDSASDVEQKNIVKDWTQQSALEFLKDSKITSKDTSNWIKVWQGMGTKAVVGSVHEIQVKIAKMIENGDWIIVEIPDESAEPKKKDEPIAPSVEVAASSSSDIALNKILPFVLQNKSPAPSATAQPDDANAISHIQPVLVTDDRFGSTAYDECTLLGCPVNMVSGEKMLLSEDFIQPGPQSLVWKRFYRSGHSRNCGLGHGWTHTGCDYLQLNENSVEYYDDEGRILIFVRPHLHQRSTLINEGIHLDFESENSFVIRQHNKWDKVFAREQSNDAHFRLIRINQPAYQTETNTHLQFRPEQGYAIYLYYSDEDNKLERIVTNWGKTLKLIRDLGGRITSVERWNNRTLKSQTVAEYEHDDNGDLVAHRNAMKRGEKYQYANHIMVKRTLATGFNFYYEWDQFDNHGKCTHCWGEDEVYDYRFEWEPENNASRGTDSRGFTRTFVYNEFGQIIRETDNEENIHQYTYKDGHKTSYTDPDGHTTTYFYDPNYRPTGLRDALGNSQNIEYTKGIASGFTDKDGHKWLREFNKNNQLDRITDPLNNNTTFEYDQRGLLKKVTNIEGLISHYLWNEQRELVEIIDDIGNQQNFYYDDWGRIVEHHVLTSGQENGKPFVTRYEYNDNDRIETITTPNGERNNYSYNFDNQIIKHSDPLGRITTFEYDPLGQIIKRTDPGAKTLQFEYDKERNLVKLFNENNEEYLFEYDGNERLIKETGFDGRVQQYKYNNSGHLIQHTDAGEIQTYFDRDAMGQMRKKKHRYMIQQDNSDLTDTVYYEYTPMGQLSKACNAEQYLTFEYNCFGQLKHEHHCDVKPGKDNKYTRINATKVDIRYTYTSAGLRKRIALPNDQRISYSYSEDHLNALLEIQINGKTITQFKQNNLGLEIQRNQGDLITFSDYDPVGRLTNQRIFNSYKKHELLQRYYTYDEFNNLSRLNNGIHELNYVYDIQNRLTRTDGSSKEQFTYDPAGTLLGMLEGTGASQPAAKFENNRLVQQGDNQFEYDARGNLTTEVRGQSSVQINYHYNRENQLVKIVKNDQVTEYKYDPLGRRIIKKDASGETKYLWAEDQLIQESRDNVNKTYLYEPHSFKPVAMVWNNDVYYYHLDHLGTPREITNKLGDVVWKVQYKAFGGVAAQEVEKVKNNLRFQGQYFDEETGLHYNRHRYYNPNSGQFISQDPIGLAGGINSYQYAPNPIGWVDPSGLSGKPAIDPGININPGYKFNSIKPGIANADWQPLYDKYNTSDITLDMLIRGHGRYKLPFTASNRFDGKEDLVKELLLSYNRIFDDHDIK